jgi:hypothetical protein
MKVTIAKIVGSHVGPGMKGFVGEEVGVVEMGVLTLIRSE